MAHGLLPPDKTSPVGFLEEFVKNRIRTFSFLATLAIAIGMICWGSALNAQTTPSSTPDQQSPSTQQPSSPEMPPAQQPSTQPSPSSPQTPPSAEQPPSPQAPSQGADKSATSAGAANAGGNQEFSGTVVKSGDKYVLKDESGKTYDIDHQTDVAKFEGKRVRVQGKLDDTGTKILVK
jgi:cytoskeletal protein RodZ